MKRTVIVVWTLAKVAAAVLVLAWCALQLRRLDPRLGLSLSLSPNAQSLARALGLLLLVSGGALVLLCGAILSTRGIFETPSDRLFPKEFTAAGPFRYTRNPMSLAVVVFVFGLGLFETSPSILLFAIALFQCLHLLVIYVEEPGLEKRFGAAYRAYQQSVNRWLPRLRA